jgi:hypothetical protein
MKFLNYLIEQKIKVVIDDSIPHEARMDVSNTMRLGKKFFKMKKNEQEWVIAHELGHWFREKYVSLGEIMGWEEGENFWIFNPMNSEEGFADAFMYYLFDPNFFKKKYPERFKRMHGYVKNRNKYIKMVKDIMQEIKNGLS